MTEEIINETNIMQLWRKHLDDSSTMEVKEWLARRDMLRDIKERYFPSEYPVEPEPEPEPEAKQLTTEEILLAKIKELEDKIAAMSQAHSQLGAQGAQQAQEATPQSGEVLEAPSGEQFVITPPPMLVQVIKTTCKITGNKVYYGGEVIGVYRQIDPDTRVKYPVEYIRAVLLDEKPDISFLFYIKDGRLFRANHPFWSATQKDTEVTKSNVCGVVITWEAKPMLPGGPELSSDVIDKIGLVEDKLAYKGVVDIAYNIGGRVYTAAYLSHLVFGTQNKKPLALFYKLNDQIVRSEHKCWGAYRLQRVAESVSINGTRMHVGELKKAVSISEKRYIKLLADNVFTLEDGLLLYAGKPFTKSRKFGNLTVTPEIILEVKDS